MKRLSAVVVLVALTMITAPYSFASGSRQVNDEPANELSISYGYITLVQFAYGVGGVLGTAFSMGGASMRDIHGTGAISAAYYRSINNWLRLGGELAFESETLEFEDKDGNPSSSTSSFTVSPMASAKADWLRRRHFGMYSRLSAGVMVINAKDADEPTQVDFALQIAPIGMEFGGSGLRGFLEFGAGTQGVLLGGVRYRF